MPVISKTVFRWKLIITLLGLLLAPCAWPQAFGVQPKDAPNLVLLEVRLEQHLLTDSMTAYQFGNDVFLPLGELSKLLTIAIRTQPVDGRASGYILDEQRGFSLDVLGREVTVSDRHEALDRALVKLQADDIYVASRLLARWLPAELDVDMSSLTLQVRPREKLPLQARLERSDRSKPGIGGRQEDPNYPRQATPYSKLEAPMVDQTIGVDARRAGKATETSAAYTAYMTGDVAGLEAQLFASRNLRTRETDHRWSLGRNDPDAKLLGPLQARTLVVGSVPAPGVANIALDSATGNGVTLGNRPLNQPTRFDRHSLQGALPPGWDVELYFNDALVGFQQSRPDGKYTFNDMPMVYGANEFRLVFHGPLGQLRVERQYFLLEQSLLAPGQLYYSLTNQRDELGQSRSVAQFDFGLAKYLSATGGLVRLSLGGTERRYSNLGLHGYLDKFILSADVARSDSGGTVAQGALKTQLKGVALGASHAEVRNNFSSELFQPSSDPVRSRDELSADGVLKAGAATFLPLSLKVKRDRLASDAQNIELLGRVSSYQFGTAISNTVRWQSLAGSKSAEGALQATRRLAGIGISGQWQYAIEPHFASSAVALAIDKNISDEYLLNVGVVRAFQQPEYRLTAALNKSLGSFGLGVNGFYSSRHEYGVGIQLFVATGFEPRGRRWISDAQPMAGSGAASVRVFLDKNQNGVMDAGDEPLPGAAFTINGGGSLARTNADGIAYLNRLPVKQPVDIGFDVSTLEDPQMMAVNKGFRIVPRPGKVSQLDFAVSITGEIDGTTYLMVGGQRRAAGDLELELVDSNRKVVATTKSASDGYFVLSGVVPGNYLLRVSKEQLKRLNLSDQGMHLLTIAPDGTFINGRELYVEASPK